LALGLQACAPKAQESCNFVQNSYGQRVSWFQKGPIVLNVDNRLPQEAIGPIRRAVATWNKYFGYEILKLGSWVDGHQPGKDGHNVIYWLTEWDANRNFEQARTTIYWYDSQIYEADVKINAEHFDFSFGEMPEIGKVDLESLVLHELGHVLGLAHMDDAYESVMSPYLRSSHLRREPSQVDLSSLSCEYPIKGSE
jgi:predicted Zn-dependent protease